MISLIETPNSPLVKPAVVNLTKYLGAGMEHVSWLGEDGFVYKFLAVYHPLRRNMARWQNMTLGDAEKDIDVLQSSGAPILPTEVRSGISLRLPSGRLVSPPYVHVQPLIDLRDETRLAVSQIYSIGAARELLIDLLLINREIVARDGRCMDLLGGESLVNLCKIWFRSKMHICVNNIYVPQNGAGPDFDAAALFDVRMFNLQPGEYGPAWRADLAGLMYEVQDFVIQRALEHCGVSIKPIDNPTHTNIAALARWVIDQNFEKMV